MTLSEIWIYPVKSLGGIRLNSAKVCRKGLQFDRRWMLISADGTAMTQREYPDMALFKVQLNHSEVSITFHKNGTVISSNSFAIDKESVNADIKANVWGDAVHVSEVRPELSNWFSHHLKATCKLVSFPEKNTRPVDPRYSINNDQVSLADAYPFLLIGQSSLDDLNARLDVPVLMNRFRPNLVFTGGQPFEEDHWRDLTIGGVRFVAVKKSARCALITVNQETAERGVEPLRTLSTYRNAGNKVFFGQNLIARNEGPLAVGDVLIPG